jgi:hypothetical protein
MFLNKKGEGEFLLVLLVGIMLVLSYSAFVFTVADTPGKLKETTGNAGKDLISLNVESAKKELTLTKCLRESDIKVSNDFFNSYSCMVQGELTFSKDCPFNINDKYVSNLKSELDTCTSNPIELELKDDLLTANWLFEDSRIETDYSIGFSDSLSVQKQPLLSELEFQNKIKEINSKKDCLDSDPDCLKPMTVDVDDLLFNFDSRYYNVVESTNFEEKTIELKVRYKDFKQTLLFEN